MVIILFALKQGLLQGSRVCCVILVSCVESLLLCKNKGKVYLALMEMVGKEGLRTGVLNLSFGKLMMVGGGENSGKGVNLKAGVITDWKDIPVELLMQILSLVDDQTVIIASEVCRGWREAICFGLTRLSLSWYIFISYLPLKCFYFLVVII